MTRWLITTLSLFSLHAGSVQAEEFTAAGFVGTWEGTLESSLYDTFTELTLVVNEDGTYEDSSWSLMPIQAYAGSQEWRFEAESGRVLFSWIDVVYSGTRFYAGQNFRIVIYDGDHVVMHYQAEADREPWPEAGTLDLRRVGAEPPCEDTCHMAGDTRCTDGGVSACVAGDDGCLAWSAPTDCAAGTECVEGACEASAAPCEDACADGEQRCDAGGVAMCGDHDGDGCAEWGTAAPCDDGQSCQAGECAADAPGPGDDTTTGEGPEDGDTEDGGANGDPEAQGGGCGGAPGGAPLGAVWGLGFALVALSRRARMSRARQAR